MRGKSYEGDQREGGKGNEVVTKIVRTARPKMVSKRGEVVVYS